MLERTAWFMTPDNAVAGDDGTPRRTPPDAMTIGGLLGLVAGVLDRQRAPEGTVFVDGRAAALLGLTGDPHRVADAAAQAGYQAGQIGHWTRFYARSRPTVHVGQLDAIRGLVAERGDPTMFPLDAPWPADLAVAAQHWHRLSEIAWQAYPAVMGVELMHRTITSYRAPAERNGRSVQRRPDLRDESTPPDATWSPWTPDLWQRPQISPFLHSYDRRRAGITAAGVAKLAVTTLSRGWRTFDPGRAGWWLIPRPAWSMVELPHPCGPFLGATYDPQWVTTADLDLCAELDAAGLIEMPQVIDSLTGLARPVLQPWQQRIERVISAPADPDRGYAADTAELVAAAAKEAGTRGIGMLGKSDGRSSIWRPDWFAAINATKRANLWRIAWRIGRGEGRWPVAFDDDAVWYAADADDPRAAAPTTLNSQGKPCINLADIPGGFRVHRTKAMQP